MSTNFLQRRKNITYVPFLKYYMCILVIIYLNLYLITCDDQVKEVEESGILPITYQNSEIKEIYLLSFSNLFFINLAMGTPGDQKFNLLIDTQHKELSLMSNNCNACNNTKIFDEKRSPTFHVESTNQTLSINSVQFKGRWCRDKLSLTQMTYLDEYPFFLVDEIVHRSSYDIEGYFGLGFTKNKDANIVYYLYKKGYIKEPVYSLLLLGPGDQSKLYLGGYDRNLINGTDIEKISWVDVRYTDEPDSTKIEWYISTNSVKVNSLHIEEEQNLVLYSGSNLVRIPKNFFFKNIKNIFNKNSKCQIWTDNVFHCECDSDYATTFPTFTFLLNNGKNNITISPDDYVVLDYSLNLSSDSTGHCLLYMSLNYDNDYWLLGNNIINNYYTIYDVETSRIGFYDMKDINVQTLQDILFLAVVILGSSTLFFIIVYCAYKKYMARLYNQADRLLP